MATAVELPKLGNTVEDCIVRWFKQKGDTVSEGDIVAEIETDKTTFDLPAPVGGTLLETFFEEGALVPVFTNLFVVGEPGEDVEEFRPGTHRSLAVAAQNVPAEKVADESDGAVAVAAQKGALSPRARRFAEQHNFHPQSVIGSGPRGRVLEEDLRKQYFVSPTSISSIREKIARRMRESLSTTAQYTLNASADAGGLLALRARIKASPGLPDITINDLVTFCTVKALMEIPDLNAEFVDGTIRRHSEIHIGFACDTPRGLLVPVIKNAHALAIGELTLRMKELTAQAVQGNISPDSLSGGTFTISNLGGLGIETFTPLLNPPQVAVLGVGAIQIKPVRKQGKLEFIDAIGLSLTCDHRVIDGAPGARFLQVVKEKIENVESMCS